ncbi:MAG: SDR family oxidoreductase [Rhodothermales bacterium]
MTIFVTGATGFLGSRLVCHLVGQGHDVRALRRSTSSDDLIGSCGADVSWYTGDLFDKEMLQDALAGVDRVFHCAAWLGFGGPRSRDQLRRVNVEGTASMVDACLDAGVGRFVHTSSIAALGRSERSTDCLDESASWTPSRLNTEYAHSKYLAELEVHRGIAEGLDAVIVNPSLVIGPGREGENTTQIAAQVRDGKLPFMPPGSTNVVDVDDVVEGMIAAGDAGRTGERYLLSGHNLPWKYILESYACAFGVRPPRAPLPSGLLMTAAFFLETAARLTGKKPLITRETARLSTSMSCYDNSKAGRELAFAPRPFAQTVERIAASLT